MATYTAATVVVHAWWLGQGIGSYPVLAAVLGIAASILTAREEAIIGNRSPHFSLKESSAYSAVSALGGCRRAEVAEELLLHLRVTAAL